MDFTEEGNTVLRWNANGQDTNEFLSLTVNSFKGKYLFDSVMSSSVPKAPGGKRKKDGYKMPPKIPAGEVMKDSSGQQWIIHTSIGKGGFGEIYTASNGSDKSHHNFVIKIEPSENGPLFCEKTVYIRIGKKEDIKEYQKSKGLKSIGMPAFYGSGIHLMDGKKFRFLVMERYGTDLWTIFMKNKEFPATTVYKIAIQVLDVLEYIHSKGYVHADIKGANLLLGRNKGQENQVYLVDFGLAARYTNEYKPDPKRAHNGTIEYISRDGHEGIITRRGDIEILGYNLIHWLSSALPWEGISNASLVQEKKNKCLVDHKILMKTCFKNSPVPSPIEKYFSYVVHMEPLIQPNYSKLRTFMKEGVTSLGSPSGKLEFSPKKKNLKTKSTDQSPPVPPKVRITKDEVKRRGRPGTSKPALDKTIDISDNSSSDDLIESTPEKKVVKRSWKDCPSVVSCAEVSLKDNKSLRRSKRNQ